MERILITGANGQLGQDVFLEVKKRYPSAKIFLSTRNSMDLTNYTLVDATIKNFKPDVVFHCAAYTDVDKAEDEQDLCFATNVTGTYNIVKACESVNSKLVYISTDYIFDGKKGGPYIEDDEPSPLNVYGLSKYYGEKKALLYSKSFIVRTSWLFGLNGKNFIKTIINTAKTKNELEIAGDQIGSPTYTKDLAKFLVSLSETDKYGIYNAHNEGYTSLYDITKYVLEICGINIPVKKILTKDCLKKAQRPLNIVLSTDKIKESGFELLTNCHKAVAEYIYELMHEEEKNKGIEEAYGMNGEIIFPNGTRAIPTNLTDCYIVEPTVFGDAKDYFIPEYQDEYMKSLGFKCLMQNIEVFSKRGVLMGVNIQKEPFDQARIITVVSGAVACIVVDFRLDSLTFLQYYSVLLTSYKSEEKESVRQLFIPKEFGLGFLCLEDNTVFKYFIDNEYCPDNEVEFSLNDSIININWDEIFAKYGISKSDIVSSKKDGAYSMVKRKI